jgi:DNA-binding GntR family transcriptional regulator
MTAINRRKSTSQIIGGDAKGIQTGALRQISFQSKHELIYDSLKLAIMSGRFAPGQRLKLRDLAADLGTSAMPVRDAVGKLIAERALEQNENGAARVPLATERLVREVMEMRALLEGEAASRAAIAISENELAKLRLLADALTQAANSKDTQRYLKLNQQLKFGVYSFCGSIALINLIESLWLRAGPFLRYLSRDLKGMTSINFHDEALDAVSARAPERARSAISRDITSGMNFLLTHASFDEEVDEGA